MGGALRGCALGVKGELLEAARVFTAAVACRLPTNKSCAKVEPFARRAASYLLRFATERGGLDGWMCSQGEPICRYLLGATVQGGGGKELYDVVYQHTRLRLTRRFDGLCLSMAIHYETLR